MIVLVALVGVLGPALGALVTWLVARRTASGRIATSQADELWTESRAMRKDLQDETVSLRAEVVSLRDEAVAMRTELVSLRNEATTMRTEQEALRRHVTDCDKEVAQLRERLDRRQRDAD